MAHFNEMKGEVTIPVFYYTNEIGEEVVDREKTIENAIEILEAWEKLFIHNNNSN